MSRYLAILNGAADQADKDGLTEQQKEQFMQAWIAWAGANEEALVDPGAPLYRKKRVTSQGVANFTDPAVAYAIVEASSHQEAVRIFSKHPILGLHPGNSIAVLECAPVPS